MSESWVVWFLAALAVAIPLGAVYLSRMPAHRSDPGRREDAVDEIGVGG